jgi:protein-histidine pros-kinase
MQITRVKLRDQGIDVPEMDREIDNLQKATHGLREAIGDLRRGSIWQWPFLYTLRSVVTANRQKAPQIEMNLDADVSFSSEPPRRAGVELLRIIQEALVNVRRHSQARHVRLGLCEERGFLAAEVVDDGRGFDPDTALSGTGLSAMQERVFEVGGDLDIQSAPGKGTKVLVRVPMALALAAGASTASSKTREGC